MACGVAIKRSLDSSYMSPDAPDEPTSKRMRPAAHCSPFRASFGTMAASLPSSSANSSSPFANINTKLTSGQLESYLMAEVRYLRRRRLIPRRQHQYRAPDSPQNSSDSEGENQSNGGTVQSGRKKAAAALTAPNKAESFDRKQFSMNEVKMICERLLKDQESQLRVEFENALHNKLSEQYETFCKFTQDQVRRMHSADDNLSYLS